MNVEGEDYSSAVSEFLRIYRQLQKKYDLRMRSHESLYEDSVIEIWECEDGELKRKVCKVQEEDAAVCYRRAADQLRFYDMLQLQGRKKKALTDISATDQSPYQKSPENSIRQMV